jgi:hypothetical protein
MLIEYKPKTRVAEGVAYWRCNAFCVSLNLRSFKVCRRYIVEEQSKSSKLDKSDACSAVSDITAAIAPTPSAMVL